MKPDPRDAFFWPALLAIGFFAIPVSIAYIYPASFWTLTDYEPLGLSDALNMAYRLADLRLYRAVGLTNHPGVPLYFLSWLALAVTGYPVASGPDFFRVVLDHVEQYHLAMRIGVALVGAGGVFIFVRAASRIVPTTVIIISLLLWLASTPATIEMFVSASLDAFALILNALFLAVVIPLACEEDVDPNLMIVAGFVGALAYLTKLSYIYVPIAFYAAAFMKFTLTGVSWPRHFRLMTVYFATLVLVVAAAACLVIGRQGTYELYLFQKGVFWGNGLYGQGDQTVVSGSEIWHAFSVIPRDRTYAVLIALIGGLFLGFGGLITALRRPAHIPEAIISMAAGGAAVLSALMVLKHYDLHYSAGVSATLPACVVGAYLLARAWGLRLRLVAAAASFAAILLMAAWVAPTANEMAAYQARLARNANADMEEIKTYMAANKAGTEFVYRVPFREYGEGLIVTFASVPRMSYGYFRARPKIVSSPVAWWVSRDIGLYVLDKQYFPTVESIKTAPNIALLDANPVKYQDSDKIIELRTVFIVIRG